MQLPVTPIRPDLRHSALTTLEECPRKFLWREHYGLVTRGAVEYAPDIGTAFHTVLQALYEGADVSEAQEIVLSQRDVQKRSLEGEADKAGFLPNGADLQKTLRTVDEIYWKGLVMGRIFWQHYPLQKDKYPTLMDPHGNPMVETLLTMEGAVGRVTGCKSTCRIDRVVMDPEDPAGVWIVDHKTTSKNVLLQSQCLALSAQPRHYARILQHYLDTCHTVSHVTPYPQLRVKGVLFNVMRVPGIKLCAKDDWDFAKYLDRVIQWYKDNSDPSSPTMVQPRIPFKPGDSGDRQLDRRIARLADASAHISTDLDYFYSAGGSVCSSYGKACPFLQLCSSDSSTWAARIEESYSQEFRDREPRDGTPSD